MGLYILDILVKMYGFLCNVMVWNGIKTKGQEEVLHINDSVFLIS